MPLAFFSFKKEIAENEFNKTKLASNTKRTFLPPPNEVVPGRYFQNTEIVRSNNGQYKLVFQADNNLVLYNSSNNALWASNTDRLNPSVGPGAFIEFVTNPVGDYHIYNQENVIRWSYFGGYGNPYPDAHWVLQDDGNFVYYDSAYNVRGSYSTSTNGGKRSNHFGSLEKNQ